MTPETFQTVSLVANGVVVVGVPLLQLWLSERVKSDARVTTEKALKDHEHRLSEQLAGITAEHQRRLEEFGLFTQRRNEVYRKLFRRLLEAREATRDALPALSGSPDFDALSVEDFLKENRVPSYIARELRGLDSTGSSSDVARGILTAYEVILATHCRRLLERSERMLLSDSLYLSDAVEAAASNVAAAIRAAQPFLAAMATGAPDLAKESAADTKMGAEVARLREVMREELRRGAISQSR